MSGKLVPSNKIEVVQKWRKKRGEEPYVQIYQDILKYSGAVHLKYSHKNQA